MINANLDTPMRFHKVMCYFFIPLNIINAAKGVADTAANIDQYAGTAIEWVAWMDIIQYSAFSVLLLATMIGLIKRKQYGYNALLISLFLAVFNRIYATLVNYIYNPGDMWNSMGGLVGSAIIAFAVYIYYKKRQSLFCGRKDSEPI